MADSTRFERGGNDMRRQLFFEYSQTENSYIIKEGGNNIFRIDGNTLKFVSLEFYNGLYAGNKSTAIDFKNEIKDKSSDPLKKGYYIFNWIKEIITAIEQELPEPETAESGDGHENNADVIAFETPSSHKKRRKVPLFEWSACAGDGFYCDQNSVPYIEIETDNPHASYAVKISGQSMEPTIEDGSVVMVQKVDTLSNGDIGIFSINGETMCKRYCVHGADVVLRPVNQSGHYHDIDLSKVADYRVQGKVLL